MSKKVKYLPRQNPTKLKKKTCKLTPGKQEMVGKGIRRGKYRSTKKKGTIELRLKSSYFIPSKEGLIQRIP